MVDFHGSQCGFCTPGFVMSLYALWMRAPSRRDAEIEKALQGNLCRCTGYEAIVRAATRHLELRQGRRRTRWRSSARRSPPGSRRCATAAASRSAPAGQRLMVPADRSTISPRCSTRSRSATIVAGSTDVGLWVTKFMREISPAVFIGGLDELQTIAEADGVISHRRRRHLYRGVRDARRTHIPALGPLFDRIGGEQVRNMGTIGGNIANGSPIGDTPPPLIALGASADAAQGQASAGRSRSRISSSPMASRTGSPANSSRRSRCPCRPRAARFAVYKITKRRDEDITAALGAFHLKLGKRRHGGVDAASPMAAWRRRRSGPPRWRRALLGKPGPRRRSRRRIPAYRGGFHAADRHAGLAEYRALVGAQSAAALLRRDQRRTRRRCRCRGSAA